MWYPVAFFSRKLSTAEEKYSTFDRELLAVFRAIQHFRPYVEGRAFHVLTDHKPLCHALATSSDRSPHQTRHMSFIEEFTNDIRHIKGEENITADTLSWVFSLCSLSSGLDFDKLAIEQASCPDIAALRQTKTSLVLQSVPHGESLILCDVSLGRPRPVIPLSLQFSVFSALHGLAHQGPIPTAKLISQRFVWKGLKRMVRMWCKTCHNCQSSKVSRHIHSPLSTHSPPSARFEVVHVDLVGPLPPSEGFRYLMTMIDRFSRWTEVVPLSDITA